MSLDTRINDTSVLKLGDEVVYCRSGNYGPSYTFGYKVTKITPTGQVTIQLDANGMTATSVKRFTKDGAEIGNADSYYSRWLDADVAGIRQLLADKHATRHAAEMLEKVNAGQVGREWCKETLLKKAAALRAALDAADAAIAAMCQNV